MTKKTVNVLLLILSFIFTIVFSGFSSITTSLMTKKANGKSIVAWGWDKPEFNKEIEDYIKTSAGVTVKGQTMSGDDEMAKITAAAAAGAGLPDCFKSNSTEIPKLVEMNALKDITKLVAPYKNLLPKVAWDMVTYKGKIWAIPANSPAGGMFYRYDVCKKYGVDPKSITTWDQWIAAGKKVVAASGGKVSWFNDPNNKVGRQMDTAIFQQNRAEILSKDAKVTINSDNFKNALKMIKSLRDARISVTMDDWTAPWYQTIKDGTVACYPIGTWFVQTLIQQAPDTKGDWYFTPFPALSKGGDRYANFGSAVCAISSQTKKVDAALEWAKAWTLDKKGSLDIGLKDLGISVVSNVALTDEYVNQPQPYFAENQAYWKDATEAFTKSTYIPPNVKENSEANGIWNRYYEQWWLGKATTEQALAGAEKEIKQKMKLK
jgi:lactose/L-arabinose transport system substrate-binding protein